MIKPPYLKPGDKIAITCPAKALKSDIKDAVTLLESWGLEVVIGKTVNASFHQFSGTDSLRAKEMQSFINNPKIKAIIAARGGYGCVRIIDLIDFSPLIKTPKWVIGFSDITVLHCELNRLGIESIHGQMPSTIPDSSANGLESLRKALFGEKIDYSQFSHPLNIKGEMKGEIIGGNLSILLSVLGSKSDPVYDNKILFIEDVGEYLYAVDRMLRALDRAGKLSKLNGLIVGGFTNIKDDEQTPFGFSVEEIILEIVKKYNYPVAFGFPAGHVKDNWAIKMGEIVQFRID